MSLLLALQGGGGATITADLAATEAQDVAAFAAVRISVGTLAATEGQDVAAFAATLAHTAALAAVEAQDIAAFSGVLVHVVDLAATEAPDVLAFAATLIPAPQTIPADLAATEAQDVAAFSVTIGEPAAEEHRGGKGDNKRGDAKKRSARQRGIVKPTGLTPKKRAPLPGAPSTSEQGDAGQAAPSGADEEAADAFIELLRETPFAHQPIAQMSLEQIEREIGVLLHQRDLTPDDEMLLVILLAAAATA